MSPLFNQLLLPFILAMVLAITMGGSGTGPAFSAAFGANVIRKSLIPGLFGIMVFLGAIIAGKGTATTMGKSLLSPEFMTFTVVSIILFAVTIALLVANIAGIPQSTSQATVMAVTAVAVYFSELNTQKLFLEIVPTWFILPIVSYFISLFIGKYIYKPMRRRGYTMPRAQNENLKPFWNGLLVLMSLYVAFSIGSNNVANAAGPIAMMTANELGISVNDNFILIMILSTLMVAPSFGIGSSIFGAKILQNTGKEIVLFGKFEAVIIAFVSASLLLAASLVKGIPTSLVQLNVAAILGIGVAKLGTKNIFSKTEVRRFFLMWLIAPIISFTLALVMTYLADIMGYLDR
ncbi:MAG: inorganic phosphate transporter [Bacteroidetes bacterium]|nr:inorganic phosphate transporter [Bacteroidota bacterium]MBU1578065.1 inorganic phosphate transporter [Bacteroidota bacterium]MBU2466429.1 inorganic phosphate transporter [Bacteroidota bacterium]MBU2556865.1 inorganic phosphate transporter [Bacteroidota bacterium]